MQPAPLEFWFDFISPYGYLASLRIDDIAARHGRLVHWRPMLIGVTVLKVMGLRPLMETPLKKEYVVREIARYCRRHDVALVRTPEAPPANPLPAARAFAWLRAHAPEHAKPFARAAMHAYWAQGVDHDQAEALREIATKARVPASTIERAMSGDDGARLLRVEVETAIARGVFGSPFVLVDGEPFFGVDKLELVDEWLREGGW